MFEQLERINAAPKPFEFYTAADLWTDEHTSEQMLKFHLDEGIDAASRNSSFIDRSVDWIVSHFDIGAGKKVADFGCGPGLYTTRLARRHAVVTGIDFSKRSIQYAQETADRERLPIHYVTRNYLDFKTESLSSHHNDHVRFFCAQPRSEEGDPLQIPCAPRTLRFRSPRCLFPRGLQRTKRAGTV